MASSQDSELLQDTLAYVRDRARVSDVSSFFSALAANVSGRRLLAQFIQDNYDVVSSYFFLSMIFESNIPWFVQIYERLRDNWRLGAALTVSTVLFS